MSYEVESLFFYNAKSGVLLRGCAFSAPQLHRSQTVVPRESERRVNKIDPKSY